MPRNCWCYPTKRQLKILDIPKVALGRRRFNNKMELSSFPHFCCLQRRGPLLCGILKLARNFLSNCCLGQFQISFFFLSFVSTSQTALTVSKPRHRSSVSCGRPGLSSRYLVTRIESASLLSSADNSTGNGVALHLTYDGLPFLPCKRIVISKGLCIKT